MIQAKVREEMRRIKTSRFAIRCWFKLPTAPQAQSVHSSRLLALKEKIERQPPNVEVAEILELAEEFFEPYDDLSAMEVLALSNLNGFVNYYEWP